jgi:hypothetical protein
VSGFPLERLGSPARTAGRTLGPGLLQRQGNGELVGVYLAQHDGETETIAKLRWLLAKAVRSFGDRRINHTSAPCAFSSNT